MAVAQEEERVVHNPDIQVIEPQISLTPVQWVLCYTGWVCTLKRFERSYTIFNTFRYLFVQNIFSSIIIFTQVVMCDELVE